MQEALRDERLPVTVPERNGLRVCEVLLQCCDGSLVSWEAFPHPQRTATCYVPTLWRSDRASSESKHGNYPQDIRYDKTENIHTCVFNRGRRTVRFNITLIILKSSSK